MCHAYTHGSYPTHSQAKITKMEHKLKKLDNFDALYKETSALRKEQEEEARLAERMHEQTMMLKQADIRCYQVYM